MLDMLYLDMWCFEIVLRYVVIFGTWIFGTRLFGSWSFSTWTWGTWTFGTWIFLYSNMWYFTIWYFNYLVLGTWSKLCSPEQRACGASQTSAKNRSWVFRACHIWEITDLWFVCIISPVQTVQHACGASPPSEKASPPSKNRVVLPWSVAPTPKPRHLAGCLYIYYIYICI